MISKIKLSPYWIYLVLFISSFALNTSLVLYLNPQPAIYDEFAYLIGADLFSQGKICAEQHPYWKHFEAFMIISQPVYCSKYLPLQSLILALGQVLFQKPILGVCLIYALTVSLSFWTFQAFLSRKWALVGSLLLLINPTLIHNVSLTFMGSAGALLGSFLIFGSFGRLLDKLSLPPSITFCIGSILLVLSRPYEGFVAILLTTIFLAYHSYSDKRLVKFLQTFLAPLLLTSIFGAVIILLYNYLTTGEAFRSAYLIYESTYGFMRPFIFSPPPPVLEFNHPIMEKLHLGRNNYFRVYLDSWKDLYMFQADKFKIVFIHSVPTISLGLLFFTYSSLKNFKFRLLIFLTTLFYILALMPVLASHAEYSNPIVAANLIILTLLLKTAYQRFQHSKKIWLLFFALILAEAEGIYQAYQISAGRSHSVTNSWQKISERTMILGGKHLVLVSYSDMMQASEDLVYNFAPIDQQTIIYARSISPEEDQSLLNYYSKRHLWKYECNGFNCHLSQIPSNKPAK